MFWKYVWKLIKMQLVIPYFQVQPFIILTKIQKHIIEQESNLPDCVQGWRHKNMDVLYQIPKMDGWWMNLLNSTLFIYNTVSKKVEPMSAMISENKSYDTLPHLTLTLCVFTNRQVTHDTLRTNELA